MLRYPIDLNGSNHPSVKFTGYSKNGSISTVALYMPQGFTVSDGAGFSDFELGTLGATGVELTNYLLNPDASSDGLKAQLGNSTKTKSTMDKLILSQEMSRFGMGSGLADRGRDLYMQNAGAAINPNTVLQYNNATIRSYAFSFKMIATSKTEANVCKEIIDIFRRNMYAKSGNKILAYPAKWRISFLAAGQGRNPYLPQPYECYIETLSATYNSAGNTWHENGAPVEIDVVVGFKETKALNQEDITNLESGVFR